MLLESCSIDSIRNLHKQKLDFNPKINFIYGENGSGKTSILETLSVSLAGKSFRTHRINDLVNNQSQYFSAKLKLSSQNYLTHYQVFSQKYANKALLQKINQQKVTKKRELTELLPLFVIHPENFHLLSNSPSIRRNQLDWVLFHVEQSFSNQWYLFRHVLKQRNRLLKTNACNEELKAWNGGFIESGLNLHNSRKRLINGLTENLNKLLSSIEFPYKIELRYIPGFKEDTDLVYQLEHTLEKDRSYGSTQVGPHRADILFFDSTSGDNLDTLLSRGQQKVLVILYVLSQVLYCSKSINDNVLFLIDDVASELDKNFLSYILQLLDKNNIQCVLTMINKPEAFLKEEDYYLFHVEQGFTERVI